MALDISAVGARVVFSGDLNLTVSEFSDEGTPFDAPDVDMSTNAKNLNGEMISSRTPSVFPVSITVIPGSRADEKLWRFAAKNLIQPCNNKASTAYYVNITITIPSIVEKTDGSRAATDGNSKTGERIYSYTNCRIKSGPTGPSTSADGRLSARTYTFECEGNKAGN